MAPSFFEVYQLKDCDATADLIYRPYSYLKQNMIRVRVGNYRLVYREPLGGTETIREIRDRLEKRNPDTLPRELRPLSVSDVIAATRDGITYAYYVDPDRLILIPDFFAMPSSASLLALDTTGYMIDGRKGSWMTVDSLMVDGKMYYLMLSETYKRDAPYIILDEHGSMIGSDPDGFTEESIALIRETAKQAVLRKEVEATLMPNGRPRLENWQKYYENGEYLRSAEISEEQNYDMIDGRINNKQHDHNGQRRSVLERLSEKKDTLVPAAEMTTVPGRAISEQTDNLQRTRK